MSDERKEYINLVEKRSRENSKSIQLLFENGHLGNCLSILRQELDSFIRIIYLGRITDITERVQLMRQTLNGEKWTRYTEKRKIKNITDKDMVITSSEIKGYIHYVYKVGCAFIHLSNFHNYRTENPFLNLSDSEINDIKFYLNSYHGFPIEQPLTIENISFYIPHIFEKIASNMACYYDTILNDKIIEM